MKIKHCIALIIAVSLIGVALTSWYMQNRGQSPVPPAQSGPTAAAQPLITTAHPTRHVFTNRLPWLGTVESKALVELTVLVAGRVEAIEVEDQAPVRKGQLVIRLGGPQIESIRANLGSEIESLGSRIVLASQTVQRLEQSLEAKLATKDQVAAAEGEKIKLETRRREERIRLQTLENQVRLVAPMDGIFTDRQVSLGQDVMAGQAVGDIVDPARLRIAASLFPPQGSELLGKEARVRLSEKRTLPGVVRHILPQAVSTGATKVWIEGPEINAQLRPGQMVEGSLVLKAEADSLAVPESAIVYDTQECPYLFVRHGSSFESRKVKLGLVQDGWAEVLSGLEQDQLVVIEGAYELYYRQFNEQFKVQD